MPRCAPQRHPDADLRRCGWRRCKTRRRRDPRRRSPTPRLPAAGSDGVRAAHVGRPDQYGILRHRRDVARQAAIARVPGYPDYRGGRRAGPVAFLDIAAGQDRNLHRCEERQSDGQNTVGVIGWRAGHAEGQSSPGFAGRIFRETRAADARDRAEPFAQIAVKGGNLRVPMTGLPECRFESVRTKSPAATGTRRQVQRARRIRCPSRRAGSQPR